MEKSKNKQVDCEVKRNNDMWIITIKEFNKTLECHYLTEVKDLVKNFVCEKENIALGKIDVVVKVPSD